MNTQLHNAAEFVKSRIGVLKPEIGIVLGSGLGKLADSISDAITIPYSEIPDFPKSTAIGHKGNFIVGRLGGKIVIAMQGRFHYYEGYSLDKVTIGVRLMSLIGVKNLFVSNAAGGCNPDYKIGDLVIIRDHINTIPNPLVGPNMEEFGTRFVDMTCPYDLDLQALAESICGEMGIEVKKGVYFSSTGPTYETPAEIRFYHSVGADLVGMSTTPEVIVARHCSMRVFGMSVVTNKCNFTNVATVLNDGDDVVKQADIAATKMCGLFTLMIERL